MLLFLRTKGNIASIVIIGIVITSMLVFTIPKVKADSSTVFSNDFTNGSFDAWTFGSNVMYSFPVQMTMVITKTEETTTSIPIQATWMANDGTVYAGSSQTLYKSQDSGITWQPLISFNSSMPEIINCVFVNKLNFVFIAPGTGVNVDELGLWRSTNNGQDWYKVLSLPDSCTVFSMDEDSNGNLFAGVYTTGSMANATILKSIDGGAHWQTVYYDSSARHVHCVAVDKANNYIYASIGDLRVSPDWVGYTVRSTNGGNDWTHIIDLPQMLAILPVDAKTENGKLTPVARLFITDYDNGQIYRTTDDAYFECVYDIGAQSYGFWMRQDDINGDIYASMVAGEGVYKKAEIYISHDKGVTWSTYKSFNVNAPYLGSSTASNFLQGTMYYSTQLESGWQNGIRIYTNYGNTTNYSLHTDSLRQVSLNSPDWLSKMIAVLLLTAPTAPFAKERITALYALKRR